MSKGIYPLFKLILGLGNKDIEQINKTALIYAKNNIQMIDCALSVFEPLKSFLIQNNIDVSKIKFCTSIALLGDVHNKKAKINKNCKRCNKCKDICSQKAIENFNNELKVNTIKCCGCRACEKVCKNNAVDIYEINTYDDDLEQIKSFKKNCSNLIPDVLEVHLSIKKRKKILKEFEQILKIFRGDISICLSRKYFGIEKAIKIINELKELFDKYNKNSEFYVQLDGSSINNANSEYKSNLEALAFLSSVENLPYKFIISGGINDKIIELCKLLNLKPYGFAFGSWARKIAHDEELVRKFVNDTAEFYA